MASKVFEYGETCHLPFDVNPESFANLNQHKDDGQLHTKDGDTRAQGWIGFCSFFFIDFGGCGGCCCSLFSVSVVLVCI